MTTGMRRLNRKFHYRKQNGRRHAVYTDHDQGRSGGVQHASCWGMTGCALPLLGGALAALGAGTAVDVADLVPVMTPQQLTTAVAGAIVRVGEPVQC